MPVADSFHGNDACSLTQPCIKVEWTCLKTVQNINKRLYTCPSALTLEGSEMYSFDSKLIFFNASFKKLFLQFK